MVQSTYEKRGDTDFNCSAGGLVNGVKGPGGGYTLARNAAMIRVGDVVQAVDGPIAVTHCTIPSSERSEPLGNHMERCVTHLFWKRLSEVIAGFLDSVTLKDLCDQATLELQDDEE